MFTGLIQRIGNLVALQKANHGARLSLAVKEPFDSLLPGESIAVDGVCLTVTDPTPAGFSTDVSPESLSRTTLGAKQTGQAVNLERSLRPTDRMGGHFVTGHVDTVGRIATLARQGSFLEMEFEIDPGLSHHVVEKGSVAVDGVSLTVASCKPGRFRVSLVPATLAATTLGNKKEGQTVNIETDILGKYVAAFLAGPGAKRTASDDSLRKALHESGFLG